VELLAGYYGNHIFCVPYAGEHRFPTTGKPTLGQRFLRKSQSQTGNIPGCKRKKKPNPSYRGVSVPLRLNFNDKHKPLGIAEMVFPRLVPITRFSALRTDYILRRFW